MAKLSAVEAARLRMALIDEAKLLQTGAMNTCEEFRSDYPRMMYRATETPDETVTGYDKFGKPAEIVTVNSFGGLLCDTIIVENADEAEVLMAEGWDVSPSAAHGVQSPQAKAASAKDERIAELEAQIAAMQMGGEPAKRGPGRPRREDAETLAS